MIADMKSFMFITLLFISGAFANADFKIEIPEPWNGFMEVEFRLAESFQRGQLVSRQVRDRNQHLFYPEYVYQNDASSLGSWETDGYTVFKAEASNPEEQAKLDAIAIALTEHWGQIEYDQRMASLVDNYTHIDVRYYSFPQSDRSNEACVSVNWESASLFGGNGTYHFCGYQKVDAESFFFEVREYTVDSRWEAQFISKNRAEELVGYALATLRVLYSNPINQQLLIDEINTARSQD